MVNGIEPGLDCLVSIWSRDRGVSKPHSRRVGAIEKANTTRHFRLIGGCGSALSMSGQRHNAIGTVERIDAKADIFRFPLSVVWAWSTCPRPDRPSKSRKAGIVGVGVGEVVKELMVGVLWCLDNRNTLASQVAGCPVAYVSRYVVSSHPPLPSIGIERAGEFAIVEPCIRGPECVIRDDVDVAVVPRYLVLPDRAPSPTRR